MLRLAVLALTLLLAACATPQGMKPGTSEAEVVAELGAPTSRSVTPGVGPRLLYSWQPYGWTVWAMQFDAADRLISTAQMLTHDQFIRVRPGQQTEADILRLFGPPAQRYSFHLIHETAWMYRFNDGVFKMAFWVQFDTKGVVTSTGITPDPWSERDGDRPM